VHFPRPLPAALAVAVVAGSCGEGRAPHAPPAVVRDSAGVTIVESPAPEPGARLGWTLDSVPTLDIGTLDGPPELQLYQVRGAFRLADGGVAVLNAGSREVRLYGADGRHLRSMGGEGDGPGEFNNPGSLHRWADDSLAVWDARARRLTVYGLDGSLGRTLALPQPEGLGLPSFRHRLSNGALVTTSMKLSEDALSSGEVRIPVEVALLSDDGEVSVSLGTFPGDDTFMQIAEESVSILRIPFARGLAVAPHRNQTIVAETGRLELRYFGPGGSTERIARVAVPPRQATDADRQAYLEERLANAAEQARPGLRTLLLDHPGPDTLPAFSALKDDVLGNTWVRLFRSPADTGAEQWIVLDAEGAARGTVALPPGIDVYEIGPDWLLGLWTDELDVEHVRVWRFSGRPAPG